MITITVIDDNKNNNVLQTITDSLHEGYSATTVELLYIYWYSTSSIQS